MKIEILGCSGGVGPDLRTTCLRINDTMLVDAGTGACELSLEAMMGLTDVFLTHAHLDHIIGLAFIADNRVGQAPDPLTVHAEEETLSQLRQHIFNWAVWPDFTALPSAEAPVLAFQPNDKPPLRCNGLELTPFPSLHTVPTVGYAIRHVDGVFAFTGDTYGDASMWAALNALDRLDQLMIEVSFPNEDAAIGEVSRHLTPVRLAEQLRNLHHQPELLLTHHKPGREQTLHKQCRAALADRRYRHLQGGERFTV